MQLYEYRRQLFYGAYPRKRLRLVETSLMDLPRTASAYEGAKATPRTFSPDKTFQGAVFDSAGHVVEDSIRPQSGARWRHAPESVDAAVWHDAEVVEEDAIYLGSLMSHFGHFLLEVLPRLWVLDDSRVRTAYLHHWRDSARRVPSFVTDAVRLAGGEGIEVRFIERPTVFRRLIVPKPLYVINHGGSLEFVSWAQAFAARIVGQEGPSPCGERIYYSRSRLRDVKRKTDNEAVAEAFFAERGFEVVHPQEHSFAEQVRIMAGARVLAGCDGSALHQAMFMPPGGKVIALDSRCLVNQHSLELLLDHDAHHFLCLQEPLPDQLHLDEAMFATLGPRIDEALATSRKGRSRRRRGKPVDASA